MRAFTTATGIPLLRHSTACAAKTPSRPGPATLDALRRATHAQPNPDPEENRTRDPHQSARAPAPARFWSSSKSPHTRRLFPAERQTTSTPIPRSTGWQPALRPLKRREPRRHSGRLIPGACVPHKTEAFRKAVAVFSTGGHAEQPPRSAQNQNQHQRAAVQNQHPLTNLAFPGS